MSAPVRRIAPGPRGGLVMGNLAAYKRDPIDMLLRLRRDHGDVVRNRLGPFLTHSLTHPDHVQHVLQENHRNYIRGRFYDDFKMFFGDGLLTTEGSFWRRHRRAVQPGFARRHIDATSDVVGTAALALVEQWRGLPDGGPVDAVPAMMRLSLSALGRMVFNADISHTAEDVGPAVRFGLEAMMPQGNLNDFIPRWAPTPFNARVRRARRAIDRVIAKVIDEHRQEQCDPSDVISLLLAARDPETGAPMSEREVHDEVMTVFLAGHETTGSGLAWALYALAQHPAVVRQLREELQGRLGGRPPVAAELETMPYLCQVVDEVLRVYPPIWGYTRDLVADDEIGGFHIPAGSSIFVSPYVTHRHPDFWPNPEAFDPQNFAVDPATRHRYAFFPFGGGMRKCIGYQMALHIMRIVVATVVQHLDLSCVPGHPIQRGALVALRPLQGILLTVRTPTRQPPRGLPPSGGEALPKARAPIVGCPVHAAALPALAPEPVAVLPVVRTAAALSELGPDLGTALRFTWFPVEVEPPPAAPAAALAGKRVIVVNGRPGSAERVAHELARGCAHAHVFAPAADADVTAAAAALVQRLGSVDGIVDLGLEADFTLAGAADWEAPMRRTLALIQGCYGDWLAEDSAVRRFYVAVTWMDGRMGYGAMGQGAQPLGGVWAGFAKTLPQELPNCNIRILDLDRDEAGNVGRRVAAELYRWGLFEIGYSAGRRYTLQAQRDDLPAALPAPLAPGDVMLFSGGARGIGLLCARAIAQRTGARVVITGREPPADPAEAWARLDEAGFKQYGQDRLRAATPQRPVTVIRDELAVLRRRRALRATLDAIAADGLPIDYRVCDVTDADAVRAVCGELGAALKIIVHNAGIDRPVRLAQKSADHFIDTVRTKVMGFAHLCAAVADSPQMVRFCNVGSLTGRWGGMTGETDYAAANDALARLGLWAQQHVLRCPVKTLAWPTWDGVGMITNLQVTKQYVATMAVSDGVRHWLAELADDRSGEVMFMGAVGSAVTPIQIRGFSPVCGLPNIDHLITRHHHAGAPERFRPFEHLVTRYRIDAAHAPLLQAFRLDGQAALPAAILIEHACGAGAWLMPDPVRSMVLTGLAGLRVDLDAAILPAAAGGNAELRTEASGAWSGPEWRVAVRCTLAATGREVLSLVLVHCEAPVSAAQGRLDFAAAEPGEPLPGPVVGRAWWNEHLLPAASWRLETVDGATLRVGRLAPCAAADLWALPHPPALRLPVAHIEAVLRACWAARPDCDATLHVARVALGQGELTAAHAIIERGTGCFTIVDAAGESLMELTGAAMAASASLPAAAPILVAA